MSRRLILLSAFVGLIILFIWQLPALLKALPSRYVAAYFPEEIQELVVRDHVDVLPTAQVQTDVTSLLNNDASSPTAMITEYGSTVISPPNTPDSGNESPEKTVTPNSMVEMPAYTPEATATATAIPYAVSYRIAPIRHHFQTWNNCGPATLAMALSYFDIFLTQQQTAAGLKPDPEDRNVSPTEMVAFVERETDLQALARANGTLDTVKRLINNDIPVIIELGLDPPGEYSWMGWYGHYLLVVAYDDSEESVWVYDSWFGTSEQPGANADDQGRQINYADLDKYWRQFNRNYIALFAPIHIGIVEKILGSQLNDDFMWQGSLVRVREELVFEPEDPFLWFNLGTTYNALSQYEEAAIAFDKARSIGLPWRMLWYQFGPYEAYFQLGRYEDIVILADVTLMDRPYFEESYYYRGLAAQALGDIESARRDLEKAARFNPLFNPAIEALADLGAS